MSQSTIVMIAEDTSPASNIDELNRGKSPIGLCILDNIDWPNASYDFSYGVFKQHRRKGWGLKLVQAVIDFGFEVMNLRRAGCEVLDNNERSLKCVEKVGMTKEGRKRAAVHRNGQEIDSIVFGLLRSEWEKQPRIKEWRMGLKV